MSEDMRTPMVKTPNSPVVCVVTIDGSPSCCGLPANRDLKTAALGGRRPWDVPTRVSEREVCINSQAFPASAKCFASLGNAVILCKNTRRRLGISSVARGSWATP